MRRGAKDGEEAAAGFGFDAGGCDEGLEGSGFERVDGRVGIFVDGHGLN